MKSLLSIVSALALPICAAHAQGYIVSLDAAQDGGGARTGSGSGTLTLSGNTLTFDSLSFSGLSGNTTASHIHGPAAPGVSAGVLYGLNSLAALGATSGTIGGAVTLQEGTGGFSLAQQKAQLDSGQWYVNIHTSTFSGGEIRGQILLVPEPSTTALLLGAGVFGLLRLKRRY